MKLIDILVQELPNLGWWPKGAVFVAQEEDGVLWSFASKPQKDCDDEWVDSSHYGYHTKVGKLREASDHDISTITREQYEAALAAKNEGWIEWRGGRRPVDDVTEVDIKFRAGGIVYGVEAGKYYWPRTGQEYDIIAYRLHKPQETEQAEADDEADLNECIGQDSSTAWSGRWLPSAGCECEYQYKVHGSEWCSFECVAVDGNAAFGWSNNTPIALQLNTHNFRPMRSEADRKRDEAVKTIMLTGWCQSFAEEIYDLVAAGKVPGMKLED